MCLITYPLHIIKVLHAIQYIGIMIQNRYPDLIVLNETMPRNIDKHPIILKYVKT